MALGPLFRAQAARSTVRTVFIAPGSYRSPSVARFGPVRALHLPAKSAPGSSMPPMTPRQYQAEKDAILRYTAAEANEELIKQAAHLFAHCFEDNPLLRFMIGVSYKQGASTWKQFFANRVRVTLEDDGVLLLSKTSAAVLLRPGSTANTSDKLHDLDAETIGETLATTENWKKSINATLTRQENAMARRVGAWRIWFVVVKDRKERLAQGRPVMHRVLEETGSTATLLCHRGITKIFSRYGFRVLLDLPLQLPRKTGVWPADLGINSMCIIPDDAHDYVYE